MNIDEYKKQYKTYAAFAKAVKRELEKAFETADKNIKQPLAVTFRAKKVCSLRSKLKERNILASDTIENEIKDLAGVRIIFYTNNDVQNFLGLLSIIYKNFDVEQDESKTHYPNSENRDEPYKAVHHIIRFTCEMLDSHEYSEFKNKNLRCEIQIQTILNHAWAEISHDPIYKKKTDIKSFGTVALQSMKERMTKIATKYLEPASHEFDKVQHDFEQLKQGKDLFDRGMPETLERSSDNNERYDTLTTIKECVIPHLNDSEAIYPELAQALCKAVIAARQTAPKPFLMDWGDFSGHVDGRSAQDITKLIVDIFADAELRYVDVDITFHALVKIFHDEPDDKVRKHILEAVKQLAKHDIDIWQKAGPCVQFRLTELVEKLPATDLAALKPVVLCIWREVLSLELEQARRKAIDGLIAVFDQAELLAEKKEIVSYLMEAMPVPPQKYAPAALYAIMIADVEYIANLLVERISGQPYALLQHVECEMLPRYRRAKSIVANNTSDCKDEAKNLCHTIEVLRDKINMDECYVRYNILVGFDIVLSSDWGEYNSNYYTTKEYRHEKSSEYINDISMNNANEWHDLIVKCAATESTDGATFWIFNNFLHNLAKNKPVVVLAWLKTISERLFRFLPVILNGLSESGATPDYESLIASYLEEGKHLVAIAEHFQIHNSVTMNQARALLDKAMGDNNNSAIIESIALAVVKHESSQGWIEAIFIPALQHLTGAKDHCWIYKIWFMPNCENFVKCLSPEQIHLVLNGLLLAPKIECDNGIEKFLMLIATRDPEVILEFFGQRLAKTPEIDGYEAVPCSFYRLKTPLSADIDLAIGMVRSWYRHDDQFRYRGGRLLHAVLPEFTDAMVTKFTNIAEAGSDQDIGFILDTISNYSGDTATLPVLMAVVDALPANDARLEEVKARIRTAGVVSGIHGYRNACRAKKEALQHYCADSRPRVRDFVTKFIQQIDSHIASEQQRTERESVRQQLDFDDSVTAPSKGLSMTPRAPDS